MTIPEIRIKLEKKGKHRKHIRLSLNSFSDCEIATGQAWQSEMFCNLISAESYTVDVESDSHCVVLNKYLFYWSVFIQFSWVPTAMRGCRRKDELWAPKSYTHNQMWKKKSCKVYSYASFSVIIFIQHTTGKIVFSDSLPHRSKN